jgi:hypothetical protein
MVFLPVGQSVDLTFGPWLQATAGWEAGIVLRWGSPALDVLPAAGFTITSVTDNAVSIAGSGVTPAAIATPEDYMSKLSSLSNPIAAQGTAIATYQARLADDQARSSPSPARRDSGRPG